MKNHTLVSLLLIVLSSAQSMAQIQPHKADLYLKVIDYSEKIVPFYKIILKNEDGSQPQYSVTDSKGNARFQVITGNSYKVFIADTVFATNLHIPVNSLSYVTRKITIPELSKEQIIAKNQIDTINQLGLRMQRPDPGNIFFKVGLFDHLNKAVKNKAIRIYSEKLRITYISKTDNYGYAFFHVPEKQEYDIAVADFEHFEKVSAPHFSYTVKLTFIPTKIREYESNDTITQQPDNYMRATTDRALLKVMLKNHDNKALANEDVFLDQIGSNKVYKGKTDANGTLKMLLPKGHQYELNFKYERAMKRLDYPMSATLYSTQYIMTYIGSKKVEDFYANAKKADGEFRTEFMEPKARAATMESKVLEITELGFNLNFPSEGSILSPAVSDNKLFVSSGYYTPNIYCLNAKSGQAEWGIKLAESGPSVLVVEDGMLLLNTQSCTLYAIDIETGILAWSKWLGPNIYHSPTIYKGKVYASYPDGIDYSTNDFVLAAFDLKSGEIIWQSRMKNEPLGAPVAVNDNIYITDVAGHIYNYSAANGKQNALHQLFATSVPVIKNNKLWVNTKVPDVENTSVLTQLDIHTLNEQQKLTTCKDSCLYNRTWSLTAADKMSYSRNRLLIKGSHHYQINAKGLVAFSESGETKWNVPFSSNLSFNPSLGVAGKYLITTSNKTKIILIDPENGQKVKEYQACDIISSEPVVANGWIYCGTKNGKLVAINTKDKSITGWSQWGMNAQHNPVIEN